MDTAAAIHHSLERLAERGVDIVPSVYAHFFAACPAAAALFSSQEARAVQGKMVNELVQTVLDQLEDKAYSHTVLATMVSDHDNWGVTLPMYRAYLDAFRHALLEALGEPADPAIAQAWQQQLERVLARVSEQMRPAVAREN